jgi:hypothetical protein
VANTAIFVIAIRRGKISDLPIMSPIAYLSVNWPMYLSE